MKSIFTPLLVLFLMNLAVAQVTVAGSGCTPPACFSASTPVDATYTQSGTDATGRAVFNDPTNRIAIQYNIALSQWEIRDCLGTVYYTNTSATSPFPPNIGWSMGVGACAGSPAPTLSGQVLPVELTSFSVHAESKQVRLKWETSSELNNAGFEIERSENAKEFKQIGFVEGNGTTLEQQSYVFTDEDVLGNKVLYYRLKQVDFDGAFEYSEVISIKLTVTKEKVAYFMPNPTSIQYAEMVYAAPSGGQAFISIFNPEGKEVRRQVADVVEGINRIPLELNQLATGIYFVKLTQNGVNLVEQIVLE